jgi:hypothetical protein
MYEHTQIYKMYIKILTHGKRKKKFFLFVFGLDRFHWIKKRTKTMLLYSNIAWETYQQKIKRFYGLLGLWMSS